MPKPLEWGDAPEFRKKARETTDGKTYRILAGTPCCVRAAGTKPWTMTRSDRAVTFKGFVSRSERSYILRAGDTEYKVKACHLIGGKEEPARNELRESAFALARRLPDGERASWVGRLEKLEPADKKNVRKIMAAVQERLAELGGA
jgi:hypothetical protein